MADSGDGQRDENDMNGGPTSRRPATVGEGRPHAADGPTPDSPLPYKTCTEYVQHLNIWILQTMQYNWFAVNYPLLMSSISSMSAIQSQQQMNGLNNNFSLFNPNLMQNAANSQTNAGQPAGRLFVIPRLWKRIVAEVIDFCFLLILKLMVTYVAVDYLELIDLDKFDLSLLEEGEFDALQFAYELTSEIIIIEMIHRLIVCAYETICLYSGQMNREGGSTPGKAVFGICVVSCDSVHDLGNGFVRVIPARNIGLFRSLLRALIKNLSAVFFIPASLTVFLSPHNRAAYDILCKCIVVEQIRA